MSYKSVFKIMVNNNKTKNNLKPKTKTSKVKCFANNLNKIKSFIKTNIKIILRSFVSLSCVVGLLYHTTHLIIQYTSGRTVVNIRVGRLRSESIPSLSICYPAFISWQKMADLDEESRILLKQYRSKFINKSTMNISEMVELYQQSVDKFPQQPGSILQLFDNLSIPFVMNNSTDDPELRFAIEAKVGGVFKYPNGTLDYKTFEDKKPIESISKEYGAKNMRKCYTFFADLSPEWRDLELEMDYMQFNINHDMNWFPMDSKEDDFNSFYVSMHSSNTLPDLINGENHRQIGPGVQHILTYSQFNIRLLPPNYDTNCKDYDLDDSRTHLNMRTDCISFCVIEELQRLCRKDCIFQTAALLRRQLFENSPNLTFCPEILGSDPCITQNIRKLSSSCLDRCQIECSIKFFAFEMKEHHKNGNKLSKMKTEIMVKHNRLPDQLIRHYPELNVIAFISSFGGLLGMWLGMSVLASFELILKYF